MSPREWIHDVGNGPFIGVMIFIVAITAGSVLFAKYCVGDRVFMRTGYDFEGYVMRKCPVCVGLPKRTHPPIMEQVGPLEVEVVAVEGASDPPAAAAPAPPPPPPVAVAVPAAVKEEEEEEEDEDKKDQEEEDEEEEFDFEAFEAAEALGL